MSGLSKTLNALYGAYRLARFDAGGLNHFEATKAGFWHSFKAALIVLPMYLIIIYIRWTHPGIEASGLQYFTVEIIAYVIGWTAYPVVMIYIVKLLEREKNYKRCIIAYNWAAVFQNLIYTPVAIFGLSNAHGAGLLTLFTVMIILSYSWFVAKAALDIKPLTAWLIVVIDILISVIFGQWVDALLF